jgi:hypothetical protein
MDTTNNRRRGALISLAVGDALGPPSSSALISVLNPKNMPSNARNKPRRAGQVNLTISI